MYCEGQKALIYLLIRLFVGEGFLFFQMSTINSTFLTMTDNMENFRRKPVKKHKQTFVINCKEFLQVILLPFPQSCKRQKEVGDHKHISPLQRTGQHKLLDINVLKIIKRYYGFECIFPFISKDVKVQYDIAFTTREPMHLCELADGCIAVVDCPSNVVRIFRGSTLVQTISNNIMSSPHGVCTNSKDQIIVTDHDKNQVHVFDRDGTHVRSFSTGDGTFDQQRGICVNSLDQILVVDCGNYHISVFDSEGKFVRKINGLISSLPFGVCVDGEDNLYVTETNNHRITKFLSDGTFLYSFGWNGRGPGQLRHPCGACVTRDGKYIVVADHGNNRVQVLSGLDGSFVASYGSDGTKQFLDVSGCILTCDGRILVSDYGNNSVHAISMTKSK